MSIGDNTENNILKLIYNATAWANLADNAAASPMTQISMALHTADPGEAGTQSTSESTYSGYARQTPARSTAAWSAASAGSTALVANVDYPSSGGAASTITHFSSGKTGGGATDILWSGTVSPQIAIGAAGVIPRLASGSTISLD